MKKGKSRNQKESSNRAKLSSHSKLKNNLGWHQSELSRGFVDFSSSNFRVEDRHNQSKRKAGKNIPETHSSILLAQKQKAYMLFHLWLLCTDILNTSFYM